jgi:hypothetical protein
MKPDVGTTARDTRNDKVGRVMGHVGGRVQLRPVQGGREWDVLPDDVEPVELSDALSGALAEINARSAGAI